MSRIQHSLLVWAQRRYLAPQRAVTCQTSLNSPIGAFCVVQPDALWRGAQPNQQGMAWLANEQVGTLVCLELGEPDEHTIRAIHVLPTAAKLITLCHLLDSEILPLLPHRLTDSRVVHFLALTLSQPKPIYVHCREGQNRTGLMVGAYRIILMGEQSPPQVEAVIADMEAYHGFWTRANARYLRSLTPERSAKLRKRAEDLIPHVRPNSRWQRSLHSYHRLQELAP